MAKVEDRDTPLALYRSGCSYLKAAKLLAGPVNHLGDIDNELLDPIKFTVGHAIECFFKAWLRERRVTEKEIRKLGHNIEELHTICSGHNFPVLFRDEELTLISLLNTEFGERPFLARYHRTGLTFGERDQFDILIGGAEKMRKTLRSQVSHVDER